MNNLNNHIPRNPAQPDPDRSYNTPADQGGKDKSSSQGEKSDKSEKSEKSDPSERAEKSGRIEKAIQAKTINSKSINSKSDADKARPNMESKARPRANTWSMALPSVNLTNPPAGSEGPLTPKPGSANNSKQSSPDKDSNALAQTSLSPRPKAVEASTPPRVSPRDTLTQRIGERSGSRPTLSPSSPQSPRSPQSSSPRSPLSSSPRLPQTTTNTATTTTTTTVISSSSGSSHAPSPKSAVPRIIGITHSKTDTPAPSTTSRARTAGTSAVELTEKSRSILAAAMQLDTSISPESLGYLLVDVQTKGFTEPLGKFQQGTPFLRGSLIVLDFNTSGGGEHTQINLIERFLQPKATALFSTDECEVLRKKMVKAYAKVADMVEARSKGMRGGEMVNSDSVKPIMDPVMAPLIQFVCGPDLKFATSTMPDFWKRLLSSIDNSIIQWTSKLGNCTTQEVVQLRKDALVAFISTRGIMVAWGIPNVNDLAKLKIDSKKFSTYLNSYFAHRAERFLADIMLTRKDKAGDKSEQQMRNYLETLHGIKELKARPGEEIIPGRRTLMKSKTLRVTLRDSHEFEDSDSPISPRLRDRMALEKARDEKEEHNWMMRKKFFRDFAKKVEIAQADPEFYRYAEERVRKASEHGFAVISRNPLKFLEKLVSKFYEMPENLKQKRNGVDQQFLKVIQQLRVASSSTATSFAFKPFPTEDDISDDAVSTVTMSANSGTATSITSANTRTTTTTSNLVVAPKQAPNSSDTDEDSESTTD